MTKRKVTKNTKNKKSVDKGKGIQNEEVQDNQNVNKKDSAFWKNWLIKTLNEDKNFELQEEGFVVKCLYCHEIRKLHRKNDGYVFLNILKPLHIRKNINPLSKLHENLKIQF
jgi:hypothetical protein